MLGASKDLPSGADFCELFSHRVCIATSDRQDFYHQIKAAEARAVSNTIGPAVPISLLKDTKAYSHYLLQQSRSRFNRELQGYGLCADRVDGMELPPDGCYMVAGSLCASFVG